MGRARPFVCTLECVGLEIRWTARTRACGTVDCSSVVCARSTACRSGPHGTVDCSSVRLRAFDCDCTSRGHGKHGHEKASAHVRLLVGHARLGKLARVVCACSAATARRVGMGSMGMEKAWRRRWDERACMGRTEPCPCRLSCRTGSSRLFMSTSNEAVQVDGVHCVRLNSYPSW